MTLWFDNTGERKERYGIRFRGGISPSEMFEKFPSGEDRFDDRWDDGERGPASHEESFAEMTIVDKERDVETRIELDGSSGPTAGFGAPKGAYVFEFSIPLMPTDNASFSVGAKPGDAIAMAIEWGDVDRDAMRDQLSASHDQGRGRSGDKGGSGSGGYPGPSSRGPRMMISEEKLWVTTTLAVPD